MSRFATLHVSRFPGLDRIKRLVPPAVWDLGYRRLVVRDIPDADRYRPFYAPWLAPDFVALYESVRPLTLCPPASAWTVRTLLLQSLHLPGAVMEAGVYRGGTARLLRVLMDREAPGRKLHLFDSFAGMERTDAQADRHRAGDFADTSVEAVRALVGGAEATLLHAGWIPETFRGLEHLTFCFVHVDLDLRDSVLDTLRFVYPRVAPGAAIVLDDYGYASCPGAREAVDGFFADKPEEPLALQTGQAVVIKL